MSLTKWVTSIEIDASPETVWKIAVNYKEYSRWNPFIPKAWKLPGERKLFIVKMNLYKFIYVPGLVKIIACEENKLIRYLGAVPKFLHLLLNPDHSFTIEAITNDRTRFSHHAGMGGLFLSLPLKFKFIANAVRTNHKEMNLRLKQLSEQHSPRFSTSLDPQDP